MEESKKPQVSRQSLRREHLFRLLFQKEFIGEEDLKPYALHYFEVLQTLGETISFTDGRSTNRIARDFEEDRTSILTKLDAIIAVLPEIDATIAEISTGWTTERMSKVDLTILRIAVYEIKHDEEVPLGVAINEAVELAKVYSGENAPAFINGVLTKLNPDYVAPAQDDAQKDLVNAGGKQVIQKDNKFIVTNINQADQSNQNE